MNGTREIKVELGKSRRWLLICKNCNRRFGIDGVNYWSVKLGLCSICKHTEIAIDAEHTY